MSIDVLIASHMEMSTSPTLLCGLWHPFLLGRLIWCIIQKYFMVNGEINWPRFAWKVVVKSVCVCVRAWVCVIITAIEVVQYVQQTTPFHTIFFGYDMCIVYVDKCANMSAVYYEEKKWQWQRNWCYKFINNFMESFTTNKLHHTV